MHVGGKLAFKKGCCSGCQLILRFPKAKCTVVGMAYSLRAHTVIGLVVAAERYGRGESSSMFSFVPAL